MRALIVWTMIASMTLSPSVFAASNTSEKVQMQNVELNANGTAVGRLVDEQGAALAGKTVEIRTAKTVEKKTTAEDGSFTVQSETGGSCAIIVDDRAYACRLWQYQTAPPKALTSFGIVYTDAPIVRGQACAEGCDDGSGGCFGNLGGITGKQLLGLGLLAGGVVAIVLAVQDDDAS